MPTCYMRMDEWTEAQPSPAASEASEPPLQPRGADLLWSSASCLSSRTASAPSLTHTQLLDRNTAAQIVATTATESVKRSDRANISTAGCGAEAPMSAHSEAPGVDTCEQGDQNPIGLYSGREPDRVARGDNISHRPNKETTITDRKEPMCSHLAELQASPHVGHFSHLSPDAPGTEQTQWPHSHLPRPLQRAPSSDAQASAPVLQLQYSPVQPLSQKPGWHTHTPHWKAPWPSTHWLLFASGGCRQSHEQRDSSSTSRLSCKPTGFREKCRGPDTHPGSSTDTLNTTCGAKRKSTKRAELTVATEEKTEGRLWDTPKLKMD
ncbi:hypothetical protein EYF80_015293 [Liparis tanakae]|uniref:Uncharacterized protein n=1 Tax=Liparis tanakae TaxID=230148 RepID=A0A4Z2IBN6_9TELE|nr:hypothetical protein EYF80_015293 [Liparis tanakae]